jgi:hypothetical protein
MVIAMRHLKRREHEMLEQAERAHPGPI